MIFDLYQFYFICLDKMWTVGMTFFDNDLFYIFMSSICQEMDAASYQHLGLGRLNP